MFLYSQTIILFAEEIKAAVKQILSKEVGVRVCRERFQHGRSSYPIKVVVYDHRSELGYFDPEFYELGFHKQLMHAGTEPLHQVIRHEIAHYMTYLEKGTERMPHGEHFKAFCRRMGWDKEVEKAAMPLEVRAPSELLRKIQKLMALSASSNPHEAEVAMMKSRELLLKHHLTSDASCEDDEIIVLQRILPQKKADAKMRSIAQILSTFFVSTVYHQKQGGICLDIFGKKSHVEIAEHVAAVLTLQFDLLWASAKKNTRLKGQVAKNSFFLGIAKGYCDQVQALKADLPNDSTNALMAIENGLIQAQSLIYSHLTQRKTSRKHCAQSSALGQAAGKKLRINPALHTATSHSSAAICHQPKKTCPC